jgi:hypothetical protein
MGWLVESGCEEVNFPGGLNLMAESELPINSPLSKLSFKKGSVPNSQIFENR